MKNFRPSVLVLTGKPKHRPALCHLAALVTRKTSLMVCGDVSDSYSFAEVRNQQDFLDDKKYKGFHCCVSAQRLDVGALSLMQAAGLGKMRTNVLMMGFKNDWESCKDVQDYTKTIKSAFDMKFGVCVLRIGMGLDISEFLEEVVNLSFDVELKESETGSMVRCLFVSTY